MTGRSEPTPPSAATNANSACDNTTQSCPYLCPSDFKLDAPCKIIKVNGGVVQMTASELPTFPAGTYVWTTTSSRIIIENPNSSTATIKALADPSVCRDAEIITVTRTAVGCPPVIKTVTVTVAKVTFYASPIQRYGYDDFDTPVDSLDDHLCIKKSDYTFVKVEIEGGALSTDFNFVCDDPSICESVEPAESAYFDLRLNAGAKNKAGTLLQVKCKCPAATSFAQIAIHVYKEKLVKVVVAKIYDSTESGTNLRFPTADYAAHTATANAKLKEAVVKYDISNYAASDAQTDVRYDLDGNGVLSYDIKNGGGREFDAIKAAMIGTGTRVAIIRDMKSYYYLSAAAKVGDTTITVTAGSVFANTNSTPLGIGTSLENVTALSSVGSTITLATPLTKAHAIGEPLEFPAAGWSSDPILIIEGNDTLDVVKWTVLHEVGHRDLKLSDIVDATDIMHFQQSWTDYRLRYCPRTKKYKAGTENQWETIPRD